MLSLCFNHVATVASLFRSSVFHFLAKLSKICEIFFSREKRTMKLSLLHKNLNTSSHIKGNLMALTAVFSSSYDWKFEICPAIIITQAGTMKLGLSLASFRVIRGRVTKFHCIIFSDTLLKPFNQVFHPIYQPPSADWYISHDKGTASPHCPV